MPLQPSSREQALLLPSTLDKLVPNDQVRLTGLAINFAVKARTQALNQMQVLLVTAPTVLREA